MNIVLKATLIATLITSYGCASIVSDDKDSVFIGAYDQKGDPVAANCTVKNDEGVVHTRSNRNVEISKDKDNITVDCRNDTHEGQTVSNKPRVGVAYFLADFLLIDLCLISCWVDGLSGSWVIMPSNIDVAMDAKQQ